jgi:Lon protease-like protein
MTVAIDAALRSMLTEPSRTELQLDLEGEHDKRELRERTVAALQRLRSETPHELVRVIERQEVEPTTGKMMRRAVTVLGPVRKELKEDVDSARAMRRRLRTETLERKLAA